MTFGFFCIARVPPPTLLNICAGGAQWVWIIVIPHAWGEPVRQKLLVNLVSHARAGVIGGLLLSGCAVVSWGAIMRSFLQEPL